MPEDNQIPGRVALSPPNSAQFCSAQFSNSLFAADDWRMLPNISDIVVLSVKVPFCTAAFKY